MLLQAITIDDRLYEVEKAREELRQHPRLPRRLPALRSGDRRLPRRASPACARSGSTTSPPTTRRPWPSWRERFFDAWDRLRPHGYDERFRRLWDFYLSSSEAGFRERRIGDVQALFAKPGCAVSGGDGRAASGREPLLLIHGLGGSAQRSGTRSCRCSPPSAR